MWYFVLHCLCFICNTKLRHLNLLGVCFMMSTIQSMLSLQRFKTCSKCMFLTKHNYYTSSEYFEILIVKYSIKYHIKKLIYLIYLLKLFNMYYYNNLFIRNLNYLLIMIKYLINKFINFIINLTN